MNKNDLFNEVNERRHRQSFPPLSKEEFITALSSLEVRGLIRTEGSHRYPVEFRGVIVAGDTTGNN